MYDKGNKFDQIITNAVQFKSDILKFLRLSITILNKSINYTKLDLKRFFFFVYANKWHVVQ